MTKIQALLSAAALFTLLFSAGCNAGSDVTAGMSESDAKSAIEKMPPADKIKAIASSPLPQKEKEKRYSEIEKETGVKAADVLGNNAGAPGTGGH